MHELPPVTARNSRTLKYALGALAALMLVVSVAIGYVVATFDPRDYHDHIVGLVKEETGRTLRIDGEMALSFWPDMGVRLGALSLSERESDERFLTVENARLTLELAPLFRRELIVSELAVTGASVRVVRDKEGRLNIEDLFRGDGAAPRFDIGRVTIERSMATYHDLSTGAQLELTSLALETGRLADGVVTPVTLTLIARDGDDRFLLNTKVSGRLALELEHQRYWLSRARVELKGRIGGVADFEANASGEAAAHVRAKEVHVTAVRAAMRGRRGSDQLAVELGARSLGFTPGASRGEAVRVALVSKGNAATTRLTIELPSVKREGDRVECAQAAFDLVLQRGEHGVRAGFSSAAQGDLAMRSLTLAPITSSFTVSGPRLPRNGMKGSAKGEARVDSRKEGVHISLNGKVGESNVRARLAAAGFAAPLYTFAIEVDQLDLDRYPISDTPARQKPRASASGENLLSPLAGIPATGTLHIGLLKSGDLRASDVRFAIE